MFVTKKKHESLIKYYQELLKNEMKESSEMLKKLASEKFDLIKNISDLKFENQNIKKELENLGKECKKTDEILFEELLDAADLRAENEKLSTKISILETFIRFEYNKEIDRLENIKRRTKKIRVRNKCESRILDYKSRLLAFK